MQRLLLKLALLSLPFAALLGLYVWLDPFCIVWNYAQYSGRSYRPDRGYLSSEFYERHKERYNAYVFGNSRALGFASKDWQACLAPGAWVFHYASTNDSLYGMACKLEKVSNVRDALLVLDYASLAGIVDGEFGTPRLPPQLSGGNPLRYQLNAARSQFSLYSLGLVLQSRTVLPAVEGGVTYDPLHNDIQLVALEQELARGEEAYYQKRAAELAPRHEIAWGPVIYRPAHFQLLEKMRSRLQQQQTRYKVVLCPIFDQVRIHPQDLAHLRRIFGENRVYDYSGAHPLALDVKNWYEPYHFRPQCGRKILQEIYP